jgi:probable phosphoglycerate mutase
MTSDHANIVFLRHGNARGDPGDERFFTKKETPLSELGRAEARMAAEVLVGFRIDRVVASDMARAAETAQIVADRLGLKATLHPELREVDCGLTDGCTVAELRRRYPEHAGLVEVGFLGRFPTGENHVPAALAYPGGESVLDVAERVIPFFAALCQETRGSTTLIVSHAWALTSLLCHVVGAPPSNYYRFYLENAGISRVRADADGRGIVQGLNLWSSESAELFASASAEPSGAER